MIAVGDESVQRWIHVGGDRGDRPRPIFSYFFQLVLQYLLLIRVSVYQQKQLKLLKQAILQKQAITCALAAVWYREVAGSNLGLGYFAPRSTQRSIPPGSVNEYQLRLGRQRQVWLIPIADERVGLQVKL